MDLLLAGRRCIVGGASRGLGFASALALAGEGAAVVLAARGAEGLREAAGSLEGRTGRAPLVFQADLARPADREALFAFAEEQLGGVDVLVVNAGGPPAGPFERHGAADWQQAIDLALGSVTHLCRLALPGMKSRGFGRIVQIVSIAGLEAIDGLILSNAARPAVLGFAKALAREVAPFGVLVNSVCPGIFLTDRIRALAVDWAAARGVTPEVYLGQLASEIPLGRPGEPAELGDLVAFLASPRNTYVTGAAVVIDGARTRRLF